MPKELLIEGQIIGLVESGGDSPGQAWETVLIRPGLSNNLTYYPEAVLRKAAPLFEGARAIARSDEEHSWNANMSVRNIVGIYKDVEYREGALRGTLHLFESGAWLHNLMLESRKLAKKDIFGLSIVAGGKGAIKKHNGQLVRMVESIDRVFSCDPVVFPAAGGRMMRLAAAEDATLQGEIEMIKKLLQLIEAKRPDLLKGKDMENISESEIMDLANQAMITEAELQAAAKPPAATLPPAADPPDVTAIVKTQLTEAENRWNCRTMLSEKLAESKLPDPAKAKVRERMPAIFTEAELDKAIKDEADYLAMFTKPMVEGAGGRIMAEAGLDPHEKKVAALDGFFFRANQKIGERSIDAYRSFKEAYRDITGDQRLTGRLSEATNLRLLTESGVISTTWAQILGDSIRRKMLADYRELSYLDDWRRVVSEISSIEDFRTNRRMRLGGYGILPDVAEVGNYEALTSPGDEEATFAISKKGGTESVSIETIANDDVGAVRRIPTLLALAAKITLYRGVFGLFTTNAACTYDNVALFYSTHGNLGSTALSATELAAVRVAMRNQAKYGDAYALLGLVPKLLLVPNELEELAFKLCQAATTLVSAGTTEVSDMPNINKKYGLDYSVIDFWTDANNWYVVGDPRACPTIEVGFFQGREEPELFLQSAPDAESMFNADKLNYKIRHIWGTCVLDHRNMYSEIVT